MRRQTVLPPAFVLMILMSFVSIPVFPTILFHPAVVREPGGGTIAVAPGDNFVVRFRLRWDIPGELGYFSLCGLSWASPGLNGTPSENFTFLGAVAYFDLNNDNLPDNDEAYIPVGITWSEGVVAGNMVYTVVVDHTPGDPRDGEFNVDLLFGAWGWGGVPHAPGTHQMDMVLTIDVPEGAQWYSYSPPNPYITVRVVRPGVTVGISPPEARAPPGETLSYEVTVTNTGEVGDNFSLEATDELGWGLELSPTTLEVPAGGSGRATLLVTIPESASPGEEDVVTVVARGRLVENSATCKAICALPPDLLSIKIISDSNVYHHYPPPSENALVMPGKEFIIRHRMRWSEPEPGGYSIGIYWDSPGENGKPDENFTFLYATAYFDLNNDNLPDNDEAYIENTLIFEEGVVAGNMRYTVVVYAYRYDDLRNGEFNVDIAFLSAGAGGVPHKPGAHTLYYSMTVDVAEESFISRDVNPITIFVVSRKLTASISPSSKRGPKGATLTYRVTIRNLGNVPDNYSLRAEDNSGWGLELEDVRLEHVLPGEVRTTTLRVAIPEDAEYDDVDNITVVVASETDPTVVASASCFAICYIPPPTGIHLTWGSNDTSRSVVISWKTAMDWPTGSEVRYDTSPRGGDPGAYSYTATGEGLTYGGAGGYVHHVELTGLMPDTTYYFICGGENSLWSGEFSFRTPPESWPSLRFVVGGDARPGAADWPSGRDKISREMAKWNPSFVLFSGDFASTWNDQAGWDNWFASMQELWVDNYGNLIPIVPAIGNHEVYYPQPQNYDPATQATNYYAQFKLPGNERWYSLDYGPDLHVVVLDSEILSRSDAWMEQLSWLENDLAAHASARWKIVMLHRPAYSMGRHGGSAMIQQDLVPLFDKYRVDLVVAGHDHGYQRSHPLRGGARARYPTWGTIYLVSAGWGAPLYDVGENWWLALGKKTYNFVVIDLSHDNLKLRAIDENGGVFDEYTITKLDYQVDVEISPRERSGVVGDNVIFTVEVVNVGEKADDYQLEAFADNAEWTVSLENYVVRVEGRSSVTVKLTVSIPRTAQDGDSSVVTVKARGTTGVEDSATCTTYARAVRRGMRVDIFPSFRSGAPGDNLYYAVVVTNTGSVDDIYDLSARDDMGWTLLLYDRSLKVPAGESRGTILRVTIREGAPFGTVDTITVTATSRADPLVMADNRCSARAAKLVLHPEADAHVAEGYPDSNYGSTTSLYVQNDLGSPYKNERAYLRFDLSRIPPGTSIASARYFNYCWRVIGAVGQNVEVRAVENDNWGEMTITWNNQPGYGEVLDTTAIYGAGAWYSWDVTSFVAREFAGDENKKASIVMKAEREGVVGAGAFTYAFESKEWGVVAQRPYLEILDARPLPVTVSISPTLAEGLPGGRLSFTVTIVNQGATADTYRLTVVDNSGWGPTLSSSSISLGPGGMGKVALTVLVPEGTPLETRDRIIVVATSTSDPSISEEYYCTARASTRVRPPIEDSFVHKGRENLNFGSDTTIYVGRYLGTPERTFLKFDLSAIPEGATIRGAELKLYCWRVDGDGARVRVHAVLDDSWSEGTLTWRNQPGIGASLAGPIPVRENGWYSWDVTSFVAGEFAGDKVVSLALIDVDENTGAENHAARFNSRDYWNYDVHPYLEITLGLPSVSASVSPAFLKGAPGATLNYVVTVRNTGGVDDNYALSVADSRGWTVNISPNRLENVPFGGSRTATLSVTIPENAALFSEDEITITVESLGYPGVSDSIGCIARANPLRSVAVAISGDQTGMPGDQLSYVVTVTNKGLLDDVYDLSVAETLPWGASVSPATLGVPAAREDDPSYSSGTAMLSVTIPPDAENGATSYMTVTATSRENNEVSASATCYARAVIRGVSVAISPSSQVGLPGATLSYTVVVRNEGKVDDTYALTVDDTAGWRLSLSRTSISLAPGASVNVVLSVGVPAGARGGSSNDITVVARGTGVSAQASCTAQVAVVRSVSLSISPSSKSGAPGEALSFTVSVRNEGNVDDTFSLEISGGSGWSPRLLQPVLPLAVGETSSTVLRVIVPAYAAEGASTTIVVSAASIADPSVSSSASCRAVAAGVAAPAMGPSGPALEEIRRTTGVPTAGVTFPLAAPPAVPLATSMIAVVIAAFLAGYLLHKPVTPAGAPSPEAKPKRRGKRSVLSAL